MRMLVPSGALVAEPREDGAQPYLALGQDDDDAFTQLQGAAVRYRIAVGPIAGQEARTPTPP